MSRIIKHERIQPGHKKSPNRPTLNTAFPSIMPLHIGIIQSIDQVRSPRVDTDGTLGVEQDHPREDRKFPSFFHLFCLHSKAHTSTLFAGGLGLHLLADLDVDLKELGDAAVQADGFAFVEIAFAVVRGDAFFRAGLGQAEDEIK